MVNKKPVSEIRQYCGFLKKIRLAMFSVIPVSIALYLCFASEKNIFLGMICAIFPYFISIIISRVVLNRRYTDEQAARLARFEHKSSARLIKNIKMEMLILIGLVAIGNLTAYFLNIHAMTMSFISIFMLGIFVIVLRPSIRDFNDKFHNEDDRLNEEYIFNTFSSRHPDDFLMDPAHPTSLLNPTNPASPLYRHDR